MQQRLLEQEPLALENVPNGEDPATPRDRQVSEPVLTVVGQELVATVGGIVADSQQFMTPGRMPAGEDRLANRLELPGLPQTVPRALAPTPLFSEKQLTLMDEMYQRREVCQRWYGGACLRCLRWRLLVKTVREGWLKRC